MADTLPPDNQRINERAGEWEKAHPAHSAAPAEVPLEVWHRMYKKLAEELTFSVNTLGLVMDGTGDDFYGNPGTNWHMFELWKKLGTERLRAETAESSLAQLRERTGIYIASKTHHAEKWKALRSQGVPIISTWIDEAGVGETKSFPDLWRRCISEASSAERLIVYAEEGEQLKGALIEVGAALASGVPVIMVGTIEPMKTAVNHPLVSKAPSLENAILTSSATPPPHDSEIK